MKKRQFVEVWKKKYPNLHSFTLQQTNLHKASFFLLF